MKYLASIIVNGLTCEGQSWLITSPLTVVCRYLLSTPLQISLSYVGGAHDTSEPRGPKIISVALIISLLILLLELRVGYLNQLELHDYTLALLKERILKRQRDYNFVSYIASICFEYLDCISNEQGNLTIILQSNFFYNCIHGPAIEFLWEWQIAM